MWSKWAAAAAELRVRRRRQEGCCMMQSRWWKAALVALLVGVVSFAAALSLKRRSINQIGFDQLRDEMTRPEVEAVLGGPPGDYTLGKCAWPRRSFYRNANAAIYLGWTWEEWISDEGGIVLIFDKEGRVVEKRFYGMEDAQQRTAGEMLDVLKARLFGRP
jgi:hypothetical protein